MKIKYIILIFAIVFGSFFCFRDCVRQAHLKSDELKLTPISYVFTKDIWTQLDTMSYGWAKDYAFAEVKLQKFKERRDWVKGFTDKLTKYQDSLQSLHPRTQIVRVKQIASSYIMNAPAHWNASYDGNKETSNGKGATNELFSVIRLSDGKIIKASPSQNSEWLGVQPGEKILKTTTVKLKTDKKGRLYWYSLDSKPRLRDDWDTVLYCPKQDYWDVFYELKLEKATEYKPLYSM